MKWLKITKTIPKLGIEVIACNATNATYPPQFVRRCKPEYNCDFADRQGALHQGFTHFAWIASPPDPRA